MIQGNSLKTNDTISYINPNFKIENNNDCCIKFDNFIFNISKKAKRTLKDLEITPSKRLKSELIKLFLTFISDEEADYNAGIHYYYGDNNSLPNHELAFHYFKQAADKNYPLAQFQIGLMYEKGQGTTRDYKQAANYYKLAAVKDQALAQLHLGKLYEKGQGVSQSYGNAFLNYTFAASQGNIKAKYYLGRLHEYSKIFVEDLEKAYGFYLQAANFGLAEAQLKVGLFNERGLSIPKNPIAAIHYYNQAAQQGNVQAQMKLSRLTQAVLGPEQGKG